MPKPLPPRREARLEPSRASGSSRFGGAAATASPVSGDHQAWRLAAKTGEAPSGGEAGISPPGTALPEVLRSEEHTSELQSLMRISYAVFCLKKKQKNQTH